MVHFLAPIIGGLFAVTTVAKIRSPRRFRSALSGYRLVPGPLLSVVATAVIAVEGALAILLFLPPLRRPSLLAAAAVFSLFALAGGITLLRGISVRCGCSLGDGRLTWWVPLRALLLSAAASVGAIGPTGGDPLAGGIAGILALGGALVIVAAAGTLRSAQPHLNALSGRAETP